MKTYRWLLIVIVAILSACQPFPMPQTDKGEKGGTLEGHISLGPMLPAMRKGMVEPTPAPEVYAARQVVIYVQDGKTEIARAQIDAQGKYRVSLPAGTYVIDINHAGIDRGVDLPQEVEIVDGQVTQLDIAIDTGVR